MKRITAYILLLILLVSLAACGGQQSQGGTESEDPPEAVPEETLPPEPEQTWFERSGLAFTPTGDFTFSTTTTATGEPANIETTLDIRAEDNGDGTKTIYISMLITPLLDSEGNSLGWSANYGFVDRFTGTAVVLDSIVPKTFTVDWKGRSYSFTTQKLKAQDNIETNGFKQSVRDFSLTCPVDYDAAAFFLCGSSKEISWKTAFDNTKPFELVNHGDCDMLLFDGSCPMEGTQAAEITPAQPRVDSVPEGSAGAPANFTGQWKQVNSPYEDGFQGAVIDGETIELYWFSDGGQSRYLYWSGPFDPPVEGEPWILEGNTSGESLACHDDTLELTWEKGQICYIASLTGAEMLIRLEKGDWIPTENPMDAPGTAPEDRTVSGFDSAVDNTLSISRLSLSLPAYYDRVDEYGESKDYYWREISPERYGSHSWLTFEVINAGAQWGWTQKYYDEIRSTLILDGWEDILDELSDIQSEPVTIAGLPGWSVNCRRVREDRSFMFHRCVMFIPESKMLVLFTQAIYDDDTTNYDYAGDFQKMLESAKLSS